MTNNPLNNVPESLAQELQAALAQTAEDVGISDRGVSVGVVTPAGTWTGATGISNLDTQQATKPDDLFRVASINKAYTSSVILKLQEQGKLSLDDTLDKWLPEIANQITNGDDLTIRQLLNGTGGLWDYFSNEEFGSDLFADYLSGSNRDWQPEDLVAYPLYLTNRVESIVQAVEERVF
ncbi:MAG: serine hydrolase domain-containing protein [Prochloraceae cyanobacterium]